MNVEKLLRQLEEERREVLESASVRVHPVEVYASLVGKRLGLERAKELVLEQVQEEQTTEGRRR